MFINPPKLPEMFKQPAAVRLAQPLADKKTDDPH
jgi:hypothetical protein